MLLKQVEGVEGIHRVLPKYARLWKDVADEDLDALLSDVEDALGDTGRVVDTTLLVR